MEASKMAAAPHAFPSLRSPLRSSPGVLLPSLRQVFSLSSILSPPCPESVRGMTFFFLSVVATLFAGHVWAQSGDREATAPPGPTSFSCQGRPPGYYADLETGCRMYHVCDGNSHFSYLCPPRTLFQQRMRICDHSYLVDCGDSPLFFQEVDDLEGGHQSGENLLPVDEEDSEESEEIEGETEESLTKSTEAPEPGPTTEAAASKEAATLPTPREPKVGRFLRFSLKDFRSLFYIPEVANNSIEGQDKAQEVVLFVEGGGPMRFRGPRSKGPAAPCPGRCDPRFLLPGTCHPCIVVK